MKKILMLLAFSMVLAMGESGNELEKNLSQKERFEILFGNTAVQFNEIRPSRIARKSRDERIFVTSRIEKNTSESLLLSTEEKYEMLFGNSIRNTRVARTTRCIFPRQARDSLYVTLNF